METHLVNRRPTLWVRARLSPAVINEFEVWHSETHLPHVLEIPGIVRAQRVRGVNDQPGTHLMLFEFLNDAAVQPALSSAQAQRARQDWDRWRPICRSSASRSTRRWDPSTPTTTATRDRNWRRRPRPGPTVAPGPG